jgi:hypothetical protein
MQPGNTVLRGKRLKYLIILAVIGLIIFIVFKSKKTLATTQPSNFIATPEKDDNSVIVNPSAILPVEIKQDSIFQNPITSGYFYDVVTGEAQTTPNENTMVIPEGSLPIDPATHTYPDPDTNLEFWNTPGIKITPDAKAFLANKGYQVLPDGSVTKSFIAQPKPQVPEPIYEWGSQGVYAVEAGNDPYLDQAWAENPYWSPYW